MSESCESFVGDKSHVDKLLEASLGDVVASMQSSNERTRFLVFADDKGDACMAVMLVQGDETQKYVDAVTKVNNQEHGLLTDAGAQRVLESGASG